MSGLRGRPRVRGERGSVRQQLPAPGREGGKALAPPRGSGLLCPQHRLPSPGPCLPALVLSVKDARPSSPARLPWFVRTLDQSKDKNWTRRGLRPSLNVQTARNLAGLIKYLSSSTRRTKKKTKNKQKKKPTKHQPNSPGWGPSDPSGLFPGGKLAARRGRANDEELTAASSPPPRRRGAGVGTDVECRLGPAPRRGRERSGAGVGEEMPSH